MNKQEFFVRNAEMDKTEGIFNNHVESYINALLKKEKLLIEQFTSFFNNFLTDKVLEQIEKITHPSNKTRRDDYIWIHTSSFSFYYYYNWGKVKITIPDDKTIINLTSIEDLRDGNFTIINNTWISDIPSETSLHTIETKANILQDFETMYNSFKENIQAFYDKVCVRRNERITKQQEYLSSLPQFVLEEEPQKIYKIKITFEEIN